QHGRPVGSTSPAPRVAGYLDSLGHLRHLRSETMTMLPPDGHAVIRADSTASVSGLERVLRSLSIITMLMTVPQVFTVWVGPSAGGVSLVSWSSYLIAACLWLVYGIRKNDKTIYLACVGWILLDAAIVLGVLIHG